MGIIFFLVQQINTIKYEKNINDKDKWLLEKNCLHERITFVTLLRFNICWSHKFHAVHILLGDYPFSFGRNNLDTFPISATHPIREKVIGCVPFNFSDDFLVFPVFLTRENNETVSYFFGSVIVFASISGYDSLFSEHDKLKEIGPSSILVYVRNVHLCFLSSFSLEYVSFSNDTLSSLFFLKKVPLFT